MSISKFNQLIKIFSFVFSLVIIIGTLFFIYFIYNHFYQVINQTKKILILRNEISLTRINLHGYQTIVDCLNKQHQSLSTINIDQLKNPF